MGIYDEAFTEPKRTKKYVTVVAEFSPEGDVRPLWIMWDTGVKYEIDRILDARQAHSLKTGGTGIRYTVRVHGRETCLWYEGPHGSWRRRAPTCQTESVAMANHTHGCVVMSVTYSRKFER